MKKSFYILMSMIAIMTIASCSKSARTYTQMLNDEKKAISRIIAREGFEVLNSFPANGVFGENQFFELSNGVYINIVDSGNGNRAIPGSTVVLARLEAEYWDVLADTSYVYNGFSSNFYPLRFTYGSNLLSPVPQIFGDLYSDGVVTGLAYVGDSSLIRAIIPFKVGSSYQKTNGDPVYISRLRYIFEQ
jgi:hypothetical protein